MPTLLCKFADPCRWVAVGLIILSVGSAKESTRYDNTVVELHVSSDGEFLAFTPTELECVTGQRVRLIFQHSGKRIPQTHDWVLVLPGTEAAVEKAGTAAGEAVGWVPPGDKRVLAATALCAPGATSVIEFTAPEPGDFPYICTTPGHAAEMRGVLHVRAR